VLLICTLKYLILQIISNHQPFEEMVKKKEIINVDKNIFKKQLSNHRLKATTCEERPGL